MRFVRFSGRLGPSIGLGMAGTQIISQGLVFSIKNLNLLYVFGCFDYMDVCVPCVPDVCRGRKKATEPWELELQMVISSYVGAGNQTLVTWKGSSQLWSQPHPHPRPQQTEAFNATWSPACSSEAGAVLGGLLILQEVTPSWWR